MEKAIEMTIFVKQARNRTCNRYDCKRCVLGGQCRLAHADDQIACQSGSKSHYIAR